MRKLLAWKRPRVVLVTRAGLALVVALVLLITLTVFVLAVPQNGHAFYGNVATTGGRSLPAGTIVVAKAASGAWTGSVNTTVDALSRYGYGQLALLVPADDPESLAVVEGASKNDPIVFYVAGVKSKLKDMATGLVSDSYPFASGGLTNLDLSANITFTIQAAAGTHGTIDPLGAITVAYGDNKMFSFTPDTGYLITDVSVDGASNPGAKATGAYTFTNVTANHTISVTFAPLSYVITPTAGANGTITPGTPQTVSYGGSQTFAIAANTGYVIADVGVDSISQGAIASYTFTNVTANHAITASFAVQTFVIAPTAGANGTISPGAPQTVSYGGSQTFAIAANTGYVIADVTVDGVSQGPIASYTFTNVTANHAITASFAVQTFVITPTAGANGTITPGTPQTVSYGANQTFAIAANTGYVIADVTVDGVSQGAVPSYTFTNVTANHAITASFAVQTFVITPTAGANGTISPGTPQTVSYGGSQTFAIAANTGYVMADVTVDGVSQGPIASYTFTNVTANHAITASFAVQTFVITPTAGANGTITPGTPQTVSYGASQTFAIAANTGYLIADVTVDGVSQGPIASYTFTSVTADHAIAATFKMVNPTQFEVDLLSGWNLFSTPVALAPGSNTLGQIFPSASQANIEILYRWDPQQGQWVVGSANYVLSPLEAVAVKVKPGVTAMAQVIPSQDITSPPNRSLVSGLNLIGPAPAFDGSGFPPTPVATALISVYQLTGGLWGYSMAVSPNLNQPGWTYFRDGSPQPNMLAYKGYWVIMQNPGTLYGASTTPLVP